MYAYEVWKDLTPELHHEVLEAVYVNNKKLYRNVVNQMAKNLRMRPERVLESPRKERHQLFQPVLTHPQFHLLTQNILMDWLRYTQTPMLVNFLDSLGIAHDGTGCSDSFPSQIDEAKLPAAIDALYTAFPKDHVTLYLKTFDTVTGVLVPKLAELLAARS